MGNDELNKLFREQQEAKGKCKNLRIKKCKWF